MWSLSSRSHSTNHKLSHQPASTARRRCSQHTRPLHPPTAAQAADAGADVLVGSPDSREDALLLAYNASQNQSLFAAQCFVETVLDAYTCGDNVDKLQTSLQLKNMQQDSKLLQPQDADLLLSWIILIMLTAQEVGVPVVAASQQPNTPTPKEPQQPQQQGDSGSPSGSSSTPAAAEAAAAGITTAFSREVLGLLQFVKQAGKLYFDEGYNITRLQGLQATVASDPAQGQSQFLVMMQQYTRLVIITLEVAAGCKLPTTRPLDNPTSLTAPSGYTAAWTQPLPLYSSKQPDRQSGHTEQTSSSSSSTGSAVGLVTAAAVEAGKGGLRAHAVRLMTAFVGAAIGSPYSLRAFVLGALQAYEAGVPAAALHQQLQEQEFAQTGGLVPALPQPDVLVEVNRTLFGRWLSLVYMSAAQLNAVFPAADTQPGWAWYGGEDAVQANAMAGFVAQALLRLQEEEQEVAAAAAAGGQQDTQQDLDVARAPEDPLVSRLKATPESAERLEAASRELQQELREQGTLRGKAVPVMVKVPDPNLEATSGAVRVWRQQVEVVQAVYQYMRQLQAVGA